MPTPYDAGFRPFLGEGTPLNVQSPGIDIAGFGKQLWDALEQQHQRRLTEEAYHSPYLQAVLGQIFAPPTQDQGVQAHPFDASGVPKAADQMAPALNAFNGSLDKPIVGPMQGSPGGAPPPPMQGAPPPLVQAATGRGQVASDSVGGPPAASAQDIGQAMTRQGAQPPTSSPQQGPPPRYVPTNPIEMALLEKFMPQFSNQKMAREAQNANNIRTQAKVDNAQELEKAKSATQMTNNVAMLERTAMQINGQLQREKAKGVKGNPNDMRDKARLLAQMAQNANGAYMMAVTSGQPPEVAEPLRLTAQRIGAIATAATADYEPRMAEAVQSGGVPVPTPVNVPAGAAAPAAGNAPPLAKMSTAQLQAMRAQKAGKK